MKNLETGLSVAVNNKMSGEDGTSNSSAGAAYQKLRDGLIWGRWKPGEKLKPQHLKTTFETTSGALREALIRLAGEGFVAFEEQRGFSTILPDRKSFYEVQELRLLLEREATRLSIENGDMEWEAQLAAAHHRLAHLEERMHEETDISSFIRVWSLYDWQFHEALTAACDSGILKEHYRAIYDKSRLHVVAELNNFGFRGETTIVEHKDILTCALDRDAEACGHAIERHLRIYRRDDTPVSSQTTALEIVS